ncbi:hypothetical protein C8Q79DRAFT_1009701 [Trametes meyenii]|nr:hypothetical protein C8Q79DRAFT_1009701 [Trametes meyenii]
MYDLKDVLRPHVLSLNLLDSLHAQVDEYGLDALKDIEHKVATSLSVVRCSINNRKPVHQLPPELLAIIFLHALPSYNGGFRDSGFNTPEMRNEHLARLAIIQVCRRWRAVAHDMASFWTTIDASSGPWALEYLERAGGMPLHVALRYPLDKTTEVPLSAHSEQIRDLFLEVPRQHCGLVPTELPAFVPDAPNLETLSIATRCKTFEDGRPMVDLAESPQLFPRAPPPRLRTLILKNQCWFPAAPYERLTHLHIAQGTPVDLAALLGLLGRCAALQQLVLVDVYLANARQVPDDRAVALPRLRTLTLGISQSRMSMRFLLRLLVLPPTVILRIAGPEAVRALGDLHPFPHFPFTTAFDRLYVERSAAGLVIEAAGPPSRPAGASTGPALLLDFAASYAQSTKPVTALLPSLLPIAHIKRLTVRGSRCDLATEALPPLPALECATLIDDGPADGPPSAALNDALDAGKARFPHLAALEVWSPRRLPRCLPRLPFVLPKLKKVTFCHVAPGSVGGPPPGDEFLRDSIPDVVFRTVSHARDMPPRGFPGVRPPGHVYDW